MKKIFWKLLYTTIFHFWLFRKLAEVFPYFPPLRTLKINNNYLKYIYICITVHILPLVHVPVSTTFKLSPTWMPPLLYPLRRTLRPPFLFHHHHQMARVLSHASPLPCPSPPSAAFVSNLSFSHSSIPFQISSPSPKSSIFGSAFRLVCRENERFSKRFGRILASQRGYRKLRRRPAKSKAKELELGVKICIEEELPDDPEILVFCYTDAK